MICIAVKPRQSKRTIRMLLWAGFRVMMTRDALLSPGELDEETRLSWSGDRAKFRKALVKRIRLHE